MPPPPANHGTTNRWRTGCRDSDCGCRDAHNSDLRTYRRRRTDNAFPTDYRTKLLRLIRQGADVVTAAERVGVTSHAVYARRRIDPKWAGRLDAALMAGRDPDVPHGTPAGYRYWRCRCPECRAAHHPPQV